MKELETVAMNNIIRRQCDRVREAAKYYGYNIVGIEKGEDYAKIYFTNEIFSGMFCKELFEIHTMYTIEKVNKDMKITLWF